MSSNPSNQLRQIVLDTETTGLNPDGQPQKNHKVIEIGAVELINRRLTGNHFHVYLNPEMEIEFGAFKVHGISDEFLKDKPLFKSIAQDFIRFIGDSELIIHNAPFDLAFLNQEFQQVGIDYKLESHHKILDTLKLARSLNPGKRNSLDALSQRYHISHFDRTLHGALLDAEILAEVYLAMTGGQTNLIFQDIKDEPKKIEQVKELATLSHFKEVLTGFKMIKLTEEEQKEHDLFLELLSKKAMKTIKW